MSLTEKITKKIKLEKLSKILAPKIKRLALIQRFANGPRTHLVPKRAGSMVRIVLLSRQKIEAYLVV